MFGYIRNFIFVFKLVWRALVIAHRKMNDPEVKEYAKCRHVLVVAQKEKDCPQLTVARHVAFFKNIPTKQEAFDLRDDVLSEPEIYEQCHFKDNPTHHDLIVVSLGDYSELMFGGLFGDIE